MRRIYPAVLYACYACVALSLDGQELRGRAVAGSAEVDWGPGPPSQDLRDQTLVPPNLSLLPKDFSVDDGPISIKMPFRLFVNGKEWEGHPIGWHLESGSTMWLALPGRGRYVLSLVSHAGYDFSKSGSVRNHVIMFKADGAEYEIRTSGAIAGINKAWNLYVLHQREWKPKGPLFGLGRLENLLRLST